MAYSDRELLARLIECEAGGEGENGMKAVAGVVMNRVHARGGEYARVGQGSIRNIIFQPYQFGTAESGRVEHVKNQGIACGFKVILTSCFFTIDHCISFLLTYIHRQAAREFRHGDVGRRIGT